MKTLAIVAMTGDQPAWPEASLKLGPFNLGRGWVNTQIPHATVAGMAVFEGRDAMAVLKGFNYVVLQHWPSQAIVRQLHDAGVTVGFWLNMLSVQETPMWNTVQEPVRQALMVYPLKGTDGQNVITWPGAIATDVMHPMFKTALCGAMGYVLDTSYRHTRPDFSLASSSATRWHRSYSN